MEYAIDKSFYSKAKELLNKLDQNQKLQQLASANGIDVKNSTKLNEATKNNIATSVIALMLAKQQQDPRYAELVRYGMNHRKTKIDLINDYKDQANQIINRAKNNDIETLSGFVENAIEREHSDESKTYDENDDDEDHHYQEGMISSLATGLGLVVASLGVTTISSITFALSIIIYGLNLLIKPITHVKPKEILKYLEKIPEEKRKDFSIDVELEWKAGKYLSIKDLMDIIRDFEKLVDYTINNYKDSSSYDRFIMLKWNDFSIKYQLIFDRVKHMKNKPTQTEGSVYKETLNYDQAVEYAKELTKIDVDSVDKICNKMEKHLKQFKSAEKKSRNMQNNYYTRNVHNYELNKTTRNFTIKATCESVKKTIEPMLSNYSSYLKALIKYASKNK